MANPTDTTLKEQAILNRVFDPDTNTIGVNGSVSATLSGTVTTSSVFQDYFVNHVDDYTTSNVTYVGKETSAGTWQIMKIDESSTFPVITYATVANNTSLTSYSTAWAARTTATYNVFSTAF